MWHVWFTGEVYTQTVLVNFREQITWKTYN